MIELFPVASTNIQAVGFDPPTETLEVVFTTGGRFRYYDVPAEKYAELFESPSVGRYFHQAIRPHHRCEKIVEEETEAGQSE